MEDIKLLIITISNPLLFGIYKDDILIDTIKSDGKTSDELPKIYKQISSLYNITQVFYVNGPGSFMSIKVSYIFLKTISIVNDITLKATDGFQFNNNSPIKALGKKYFFKTKDDKIHLDFLNDEKIEQFSLPKKLDISIFSDDIEPNYNLPAVN